jgi:hypothetical protein
VGTLTAKRIGCVARIILTHIHANTRMVFVILQWNQSKEDYMGQKKDELFQDQIAFLVKKEKYTLNDFYEFLKCVRLFVCVRACVRVHACVPCACVFRFMCSFVSWCV